MPNCCRRPTLFIVRKTLFLQIVKISRVKIYLIYAVIFLEGAYWARMAWFAAVGKELYMNTEQEMPYLANNTGMELGSCGEYKINGGTTGIKLANCLSWRTQ